MIHHKPKVIDLCCGAGGFSEGFRQAGFDIILGVDIWGEALESFKHNQKCDIWEKDIRNVLELPIDCDVLIGSPPCQKLSRINTKRNVSEGLELIREFERIVNFNGPDYWVWENVEWIKNIYSQAHVLNSFDFGLAQRRIRAFVSNFSFFRMNYLPGIISPEYIYDGSLIETVGKSKSGWKHTTKSGTVCTKRIRDAQTNEYLSIDTVKKLMGFPFDYYLYGSISIQQKQLGNAVCPPVAKVIAEGIKNEEGIL